MIQSKEKKWKIAFYFLKKSKLFGIKSDVMGQPWNLLNQLLA